MGHSEDSKNQLIVFGDDWGRHPSSSQHLIRELLGSYEVVWVNSVGMRPPKARWQDLKRVWHKLTKGMAQSVERFDDGPTVVNPLVLPFHGVPFVQKLNKYILAKQLQKHIKEGVDKILWISNPLSDYLKTIVDFDKLIYYCGDDFTSFHGIDSKLVKDAEKELYQKAHLIIFASSDLKEKREIRCTGQVLHVPHGVGRSRFGKVEDRPRELHNVSQPIVGYMGIFEEWINVDLLIEVIDANPDLTFCLIGDPNLYRKRLSKFRNVVLTGRQSHERLPEFLQYFDVGLLLYRKSKMTKAITPLKLYEYYAQGIPVVSTLDFPGLNGFQHVAIASTPAEFSDKVRAALGQKELVGKQLIDIAENNSWAVRAQYLMEQLERLATEKLG